RIVPPLLYAHEGNDDGAERTWFAQSWLFHDKHGWDAGSFPLYAGGRHADHYYDLTPIYLQFGDATSFVSAVPLLYTHWGEPGHDNTILLTGWSFTNEDGNDNGIFPLYAAGAHKDGHYFLTPLGGAWGDEFASHLWVL